MLTVDRFFDELGAVTEGFGLDRAHVYGHSWGAMLGLQFPARRGPEWTSLVCASGSRPVMPVIPHTLTGREPLA
ncbi:hypothetical protein JK364_51605 [Streptomyces sp. 110]|uniref:Alpha/beta hydrolase n=1 Tax=Streptomyces endocoffeicus TaxID=2898945 RepID=A0ABS1Q8I7_9ACTN|nr:alpha/beta hydrolase [Streptomyces endocoffeicus]MBL1120654.1 hypothetical protein [Streptomyces endocoffeicus]